MYTRTQRSVALLYGVACHLAFASAVGAMMWKLYTGLHGGPNLPLGAALAWDILLVLQFPLFHSLLLTDTGGRWMSRMTPARIGTELRTTTFALIASLQLLGTFLCWAPLGPVFGELEGVLKIGSTALYGCGWILLMKSMSDAGLGIQMGYLGWLAVFRNRKPVYKDFEEKGTLKVTRHPMYFAYTLLLWTGPVWTPDHLLLAGCWTVYCLFAPLHKESRYRKRYGDVFRAYQKRVPYLVPLFLTHRKTRHI